MTGARILVIGATSAIAEAYARDAAKHGARLYLLARDGQRVQAIADDLLVRGAICVATAQLDVTATTMHAAAIDAAWATLGTVDVVLIAHGTLPDQNRCVADTEYALHQFAVNATATIALANCIARKLALQRCGTLAVISSVAGDRGRASNAVYGAAKAAVSTYLSALRQRLTPSGVQVLAIKPGFVDTPMTAAITNKGPLWATPDQIAGGIARAIRRGRTTVYLPWYWWPIMLVIRSIPEPIFRRLRL